MRGRTAVERHETTPPSRTIICRLRGGPSPQGERETEIEIEALLLVGRRCRRSEHNF